MVLGRRDSHEQTWYSGRLWFAKSTTESVTISFHEMLRRGRSTSAASLSADTLTEKTSSCESLTSV